MSDEQDVAEARAAYQDYLKHLNGGDENAPLEVNTAPGAFGRSINIPGLKPQDLEKLKAAMINNAPSIGATVGEMALPPYGAYPGALAGSAIKQYFNPPQDVKSGGIEAAKDIAYNAAIPQVLGFGIRNVIKPLGKGIYNSAFGQLNELSRQKGKIPISDVLFRNKITGNAQQIGQRAVDTMPVYDAARSKILNAIDEAGIRGNLESALAQGKAYANSLASSRLPEDQSIGKALLKDIENKYSPVIAKPAETTSKTVASNILDSSGKPIEKTVTETAPEILGPNAKEMQRLKSSSGRNITQAEWDALSPHSRAQYTRGQKIVGGGLKSELENMAAQESPESLSSLQSTNADQGALLTTAKKLNQNALKMYNKHLVTPVDMMTYTMGNLADEGASKSKGLTAAALKKLGDLYKTQWARTNLGMGLYDLGNTQLPIIENGIRYTPWKDIYNDATKQYSEENQ